MKDVETIIAQMPRRITQAEALELYLKMLARLREIQLHQLRIENSRLRSLLSLK